MSDSVDPAPEALRDSYRRLLEGQPWELDVAATAAESGAPPGPVLPPSAAEKSAHSSSPSPPPLERIVEALLFVEAAPLNEERAVQAIRGLTPDQLQEAVHSLNQRYRAQNRPYAILREEDGYRLLLRPRHRWVVDKLYGRTRLAHLSVPALEVLSVVAYRQPVKRTEVENLRGRDCGALLRQLVRRGLIALLPSAEGDGADPVYGTTPRFLELFGLNDLSELPETDDLQRL